jgi:hypothetical protein
VYNRGFDSPFHDHKKGNQLPRFSIDDLKRVQEEEAHKLKALGPIDPIEGGKYVKEELENLIDEQIMDWVLKMGETTTKVSMLLGMPPAHAMADMFLMGMKLGIQMADKKNGTENQMSVNLKFMH